MKTTKLLSILLLLLLTVTFSQKSSFKEVSISRNIVIPELRECNLNIDSFNKSINIIKYIYI